MHPTLRLLKAKNPAFIYRITLFTRENCSLCTTAKETLAEVWERKPFVFREVDVMSPGGKGWKDLYEFDTPVV